MNDDVTPSSSPNPGAQPAPQIRILGQYVKDLSFENPSAPDSLRNDGQGPQIDINLGVGATPRQDNSYEVVLSIKAEAKNDNAVAFIVELAYAGWFQFENAPQQLIEPLVRVEAPRMLFPFARRILADMTRDGGFPPLFLEPIDFAALYVQQRKQAEQEQASGTSEGNANGSTNGSSETSLA